MASIYRNKGGWRALVNRRGRCTSKWFRLKRDAEQWARDDEYKADRARYSNKTSLRIAELPDNYTGDIIEGSEDRAHQEKAGSRDGHGAP
ncbi:MAG: hypothetical protein U9R74_13460 [Pseudomonadota bacterium]|nr:hypothetical protein [Pseudomonadota bacterium]